MIDWLGVLISAIWILGLALLLATISIAYSFAHGKSLRAVLHETFFRLALVVGVLLFATGMTFSVETWWERAGWVMVIGLTLWDGISVWRAARSK